MAQRHEAVCKSCHKRSCKHLPGQSINFSETILDHIRNGNPKGAWSNAMGMPMFRSEVLAVATSWEMLSDNIATAKNRVREIVDRVATTFSERYEVAERVTNTVVQAIPVAREMPAIRKRPVVHDGYYWAMGEANPADYMEAVSNLEALHGVAIMSKAYESLEALREMVSRVSAFPPPVNLGRVSLIE